MAHPHTSLVFDIQSGAIGASLIVHEAEPKAIWYTQRMIPVLTRVSLPHLLQATQKTLEHIAREAYTNTNTRSCERIICLYGAPWHFSQSVRILIERDTPFTVTPKFLHSLIEKEERTLAKELETATHGELGKPVLCDRAITHIALNGYPVTNPYQKHITRLACAVSLSISPETFVHTVHKTIQNIFPGKTIIESTVARAASIALQKNPSTPHDFVLLLISGEVTEINLINNGEVRSTASVPVGTHALLQACAHERDHTLALSLVDLHIDGHGDPEWSSKITKRVAEQSALWTDAVLHALDTFSAHNTIPKTAYIFGDRRFRSLFNNHIDMKYISHTSFIDPALNSYETAFAQSLLKKSAFIV